MSSLTVTDESITLTKDGSSTSLRWVELSRFVITMPEYDWIITSQDGRQIIISADLDLDETDEFTERMGDLLPGWDDGPAERYHNICVNDDVEAGEYLIWSRGIG